MTGSVISAKDGDKPESPHSEACDLVVDCLLFVVNYLLCVVNYLLFVVNDLLLVIDRLLL